VTDLATSHNSGSYRLRSLNLSAMKRRDPRTHLESGRNFVVDWNAIDLTYLDLVSPTWASTVVVYDYV
jgi:hypothetical protein